MIEGRTYEALAIQSLSRSLPCIDAGGSEFEKDRRCLRFGTESVTHLLLNLLGFLSMPLAIGWI